MKGKNLRPGDFVTAKVTAADGYDLAARTMHLALHAAQNGSRVAKPMADLRRGLAQVGPETWGEAAELAKRLGAFPAFAEGMRLCPEGVAMADDLRLSRTTRDVELELRLTSAPNESLFFAKLADTPGLREKAALVGRKLWPSRDYMRMNFQAARGGRVGLLVSHVQRPISLLGRGGPALAAWARARRRLGRDR